MNSCHKLQCIICLLIVNCSSAEERIVIGVEETPYYPHYQFGIGKELGFAPEVFEAFATKSGYIIEYKVYPVTRLYAEFLSGQIDLKYPDNPNWQVERKSGYKVNYSSPVVQFSDGIMVRPENVGRGLSALRTISLQRGFTPWNFTALVNSGQISLMENNSLEGAIRQAQTGRSDGVYANVQVINYILNDKFQQPGSLIHDTKLPSSNGFYHLSTIHREEVLLIFNDFLAKEKQHIDRLRSKYGLQ